MKILKQLLFISLFSITSNSFAQTRKPLTHAEEIQRDTEELAKIKYKYISFQNFFFGLSERRVAIYKRTLLYYFNQEIEQNEAKCKRDKAYKRLNYKRLSEQKRIVKDLSRYTFSFKDGDIPKARAKKKLVERFIKLIEAELKSEKLLYQKPSRAKKRHSRHRR